MRTPTKVLRLLPAVPQPVWDAATAVLLAVLLAPERLEACSTQLQGELHQLVACEDAGLIAAYTRQTQRDLPGRLAESAPLHACCFMFWWREDGPGQRPARP